MQAKELAIVCWKYSRERTFSELTPTSKHVNLCFTAAFYGERMRKKSPSACHTTTSICHSSLCATYPMQPPPFTRYCHLLSLLLPVMGTPLPGFSDPLDVFVCIFPSLPLSSTQLRLLTMLILLPFSHTSTCIWSQTLWHTRSRALSSPLPQYLCLCTKDGHPWGLASAFAFAVITGKLRRIWQILNCRY